MKTLAVAMVVLGVIACISCGAETEDREVRTITLPVLVDCDLLTPDIFAIGETQADIDGLRFEVANSDGSFFAFPTSPITIDTDATSGNCRAGQPPVDIQFSARVNTDAPPVQDEAVRFVNLQMLWRTLPGPCGDSVALEFPDITGLIQVPGGGAEPFISVSLGAPSRPTCSGALTIGFN